MPRPSRYTAKQDRQAQHIADSERARGKSAAEAKTIGYATVNKQKAPASKKRSKRAPRYK